MDRTYYNQNYRQSYRPRYDDRSYSDRCYEPEPRPRYQERTPPPAYRQRAPRERPAAGPAVMDALVDELTSLRVQVSRLGSDRKKRTPARGRPQPQGPRAPARGRRRGRNTGGGTPRRQGNQQQRAAAAGNNKKKKKRGRPQHDVRVKTDSVKGSVFEIKHEDTHMGWAVMIGSRIYKPAHVQGVIDHPELSKVKFLQARDLDLQVGTVPRSMKKLSAKPGPLVDGVYSWQRGAISVASGVVVDLSKGGKKGDSGRPILDNEGRVVGLVLGGALSGDEMRLSVIGFDSKKLDAIQLTYPEADRWSAGLVGLLLLPAVLSCTLDGASFDCAKPSCQACCVEKEPAKALKLLEQNLDDENYWDLLLAVTNCPTARAKRSVDPDAFEKRVLSAHQATSTYRSYCPDCGGHPCLSPLGIDEVVGSGLDRHLRIRVGSQFGVDAAGKAASPDSIRYTARDGSTYSSEHPRLTVSTSSGCEILQAVGHYILADCPAGNSIDIRATMAGVRYQCHMQHNHKVVEAYTRERNAGGHLSDKTQKCAKFTTVRRTTSKFLVDVYEPVPVAVPSSQIVKCNGSSCVITVPASSVVVLKKACDAASNVTETTYNASTTEECTTPRYEDPVVKRTKPHLRTHGLPKHGDTVKAKIPLPFPTVTADCRLSKARMPRITSYEKHMRLAGKTDYPVRLTTRDLSGTPNTTDMWVEGKYDIDILVPVGGVEIRWGNNEPAAYWSVARYAAGNADAHPWELLVHHSQEHPVYTWVFVGIACAALLLAGCMCCVACRRVRYTLLARSFNPTASYAPSLAGALCCLPGATAETPYLDAVAYLWTNNKVAFGLQFAAPVACLLILTYAIRHCRLCCKSFLGLRGLLLAGAVLTLAQSCTAYEHTVTIPMDPRAPQYEAIVSRPGYEPMKLEIGVNFTVVTPTTSLAYWTCQGKTVVEPPHVGCCTSITCPHDLKTLRSFIPVSIGGEQCEVFTNVYPLLWGAAHCFCSNENTQVSAVAATVSEYCAEEPNRAEALSVHSGTVSAELMFSVGEDKIAVHAYVDGVTSASSQGYKVVAGPISSDYSPFDTKVVRLGTEIYNFDWPPYAAGKAGTFGDIQARSQNYAKPGDLFADMDIQLLQPSNSHVHVAYTNTESGFLRWLQDSPTPLSSVAPHGCKIKAKPLLALDCGVGNVPVSINIPDAKFTRIVQEPQPSALTCKVPSCQYGVDLGGALVITLEGHYAGKCAIHSTTPGITAQAHVADITPGPNTIRSAFTASTPEVSFDIEVCNEHVKCTGTCKPPNEHIKPVKPRVDSDNGAYISTPAMSWAGGLLTLLLFIFAASLVIWCCVKQCRSRRVNIVRR
ncbi:structural protein [Comber alphavirus]|nr:structural protein [Comber alphavirus]